MKKVATLDGTRRLLRVGRDGKNRYCIYYLTWILKGGERAAVTHSFKREVVAGGLTKLAAYGMMKLFER